MKDIVTYPLSAISGEDEDRIEQLARVKTPRTDAEPYLLRRADGTFVEAVEAVTCRQLERELVEAKEELNDKRKFCYAVEQALDGMKGDYVEIIAALRKEGGK